MSNHMRFFARYTDHVVIDYSTGSQHVIDLIPFTSFWTLLNYPTAREISVLKWWSCGICFAYIH